MYNTSVSQFFRTVLVSHDATGKVTPFEQNFFVTFVITFRTNVRLLKS